MPLYEFACAACGVVFEELVKSGSTGEGLACPQCGGTKVKKQMSTFAAHTETGVGQNYGAKTPPPCAGSPGCSGACGHVR